MSCYVDASIWAFGRMHMCHLIADTEEELMAMADKIGVQRKWLQAPAPRHPYPHFDICKSKRAAAVKAGAKECCNLEFKVVMDRLRAVAAKGAK